MGYLDSSVKIKNERVWVDSLKTSQRKEAKDECRRNGSRNALDNVLKTGPDRPVQPVQPSTGHNSDPIYLLNRLRFKPVTNRQNRRSDR